LDADNVDLIATKYAKQIEKQVQVPRFDAIQLVHKLGQKCTNKTSTSQYFDWKFLGVEAGICFNAIPERVTFLAGALDHQVTVKAKTVRQARVKSTISDEVEVKPEAVDNTTNKGDADKLSAMEKAMRVIRKKLKARSEEIERSSSSKSGNADEHPDIDMVQFLFNPQSFTQTVENIFNFSFLIKKGEAAIGVRPKSSLGNSHGAIPSGAYVAYRTYNASAFESDPNDNNSSSSSATQAVCRFTMADWRRLCQQQDAASTTGSFAQGDIPHRTGTKHGRNSQ
jgi:Nse4 C-terminal